MKRQWSSKSCKALPWLPGAFVQTLAFVATAVVICCLIECGSSQPPDEIPFGESPSEEALHEEALSDEGLAAEEEHGQEGIEDGGMEDGDEAVFDSAGDLEPGEDEDTDGSSDNDCQCQPECNGRQWTCNQQVGLAQPLPLCLPDDPCRCLSVELQQECTCEVTEPSLPPSCRTGELGRSRGRLDVDDGPPLSRVDEDGITRYACLFVPPGAGPQNRYPLVVWLHGGGGGSADDLYDATSLREKADPSQPAAFDLGGQNRPGFILLVVQSRRLHYPTDYPRDGQHHDFYHRDLGRPSTNRDITNLDAFIDMVADRGVVDPNRIYLMGWSNGCFFAQLYAFARFERGTPAGNRPAAVACYSGADPFANINRTQEPSCELNPYPTTRAPILLVGRNCDHPTCDRAQADYLLSRGMDIEPGHVMDEWIEKCRSGVAPAVERMIIDGAGRVTSQCLPPDRCTQAKAIFNHIRWPDGKSSLDSVDQEPAMLEFLRSHPLQ